MDEAVHVCARWSVNPPVSADEYTNQYGLRTRQDARRRGFEVDTGDSPGPFSSGM